MSQHDMNWADSSWDSPADVELRDLIRKRIRLGRLPKAQGHRLFGGRGEGTPCACCDRFITSSQIQFDIESPRAGGWVSYAMHQDCFEVWRTESRTSSPRRAREVQERDTVSPP